MPYTHCIWRLKRQCRYKNEKKNMFIYSCSHSKCSVCTTIGRLKWITVPWAVIGLSSNNVLCTFWFRQNNKIVNFFEAPNGQITTMECKLHTRTHRKRREHVKTNVKWKRKSRITEISASEKCILHTYSHVQPKLSKHMVIMKHPNTNKTIQIEIVNCSSTI